MKTIYKKPESIGKYRPNTYCPGCMHSTVVRLIAEVLEELDQEKLAVCFSGVGCNANGTFGYIDIDALQIPHGRACASASAYKRCNPENLVFTYQGDGDFASIGFAESMHAANRGENITAIFVNNAQYGMTGGQMAPTTLMGMKTTTSPYGRTAAEHGYPMHMCELISNFAAPSFIARGTCTSPKNVRDTKSYIKKAFRNQLDGKGFSIVEVVSACPSNWGMSPLKCLDFIDETMLKEYPIGVFRDK